MIGEFKLSFHQNIRYQYCQLGPRDQTEFLFCLHGWIHEIATKGRQNTSKAWQNNIRRFCLLTLKFTIKDINKTCHFQFPLIKHQKSKGLTFRQLRIASQQIKATSNGKSLLDFPFLLDRQFFLSALKTFHVCWLEATKAKPLLCFQTRSCTPPTFKSQYNAT